jgi:hypothetical protein
VVLAERTAAAYPVRLLLSWSSSGETGSSRLGEELGLPRGRLPTSVCRLLLRPSSKAAGVRSARRGGAGGPRIGARTGCGCSILLGKQRDSSPDRHGDGAHTCCRVEAAVVSMEERGAALCRGEPGAAVTAGFRFVAGWATFRKELQPLNIPEMALTGADGGKGLIITLDTEGGERHSVEQWSPRLMGCSR